MLAATNVGRLRNQNLKFEISNVKSEIQNSWSLVTLIATNRCGLDSTGPLLQN